MQVQLVTGDFEWRWPSGYKANCLPKRVLTKVSWTSFYPGPVFVAFHDFMCWIVVITTILLPSVGRKLTICGGLVGFYVVPFFTLCCILRETLAHNNSFPYRFSKDQLKTVERQLSDAGRTQDPAFKGIPQHGYIVGQCSIIFFNAKRYDATTISWPCLGFLPDTSLKSEQCTCLYPSRHQSRVVVKCISPSPPLAGWNHKKISGRLCSTFASLRKSWGAEQRFAECTYMSYMRVCS